MANKMKEYRRYAESYERRWENAVKTRNAAEAFSAFQQYRDNIAKQEKELETLDPNSSEYERASIAIDAQKGRSVDMMSEQRLTFTDGEKRAGYQQLDDRIKNMADQMESATRRKDPQAYESYRDQYVRDLEAQEFLGDQMRGEGNQFDDTLHENKVELLSRDIAMRDALNERIAAREAKGQKVSPEDREAAERATEQVKKDEIDLVRYQDKKIVEGMEARGASQQEIDARKEQNEETEHWVESINR